LFRSLGPLLPPCPSVPLCSFARLVVFRCLRRAVCLLSFPRLLCCVLLGCSLLGSLAPASVCSSSVRPLLPPSSRLFARRCPRRAVLVLWCVCSAFCGSLRVAPGGPAVFSCPRFVRVCRVLPGWSCPFLLPLVGCRGLVGACSGWPVPGFCLCPLLFPGSASPPGSVFHCERLQS